MNYTGKIKPVEVKFPGALVSDNAGIDVALCTLPLKAGYRATLNMFDTSFFEVKPMTVAVTGREKVSTEAGSFDAFVVDDTEEARLAAALMQAFALPPGLRAHLGDIIVSVERAIAQAEQGRGGQTGDVKWDSSDELLLLAVHGTLHICGWDHAEPVEEAAMRSLERSVLASLSGQDGHEVHVGRGTQMDPISALGPEAGKSED